MRQNPDVLFRNMVSAFLGCVCVCDRCSEEENQSQIVLDRYFLATRIVALALNTHSHLSHFYNLLYAAQICTCFIFRTNTLTYVSPCTLTECVEQTTNHMVELNS